MVQLDPNDPNTVFLCDSIMLQGSTGMTSEFFPEESQEKLSELIDGLKTFIDNANSIIGSPENQNNFKATLANLSEASEQAKYTLEEFEKLAASGESTLEHVDTKLDEIVTIATDTTNDIRKFVNTGTEVLKSTDDNIGELVKSIVVSSEEIARATSQLRLIMEKINNGDGTASRLVNDPRLYEKLLDDTEQLQELLKSMKSLIEKIDEKGLGKVWSGK
jgi:phospholipid/cholesterol/gamma-HCH transport system substrate-binding protein